MMKSILFAFLLFSFCFADAQLISGSFNSATISNDHYYSNVGGIIVNSEDFNISSLVSGALPLTNEITSILNFEDIEMQSTEVNVYPNPTLKSLQINSNKNIKIVELYDVLGKKVMSVPFQKIIDLSGLPSGLYILNFPNTKFKSIKILKK